MKSIDFGLLGALLLLSIFGLVMMSSMSIVGSYDLTEGASNSFYFKRHFIYTILGYGVFFMALKFPYETLRRTSVLIFLISIILLGVILIKGESWGTAARSWIRFAGFSFQPVELAKLATIIFLATVFSTGKNNASSLISGFVPFSIILAIPSLLIIAQPDFGSLFILILSASAVYFVAGADLKHFLGGATISVLSALIIIFTNDYIYRRVQVFLDPSLDPLNSGFQVKQALIAIGSGGVFGRGFHNSIQKYDYLPEVQSDTIFAAISEEMGFFRILLLIGIYLFIAHRGFNIARKAPDEFSKLVAVGITTWIVGQAFVNIAVNLALFPNTGITLPLISYGGSSLLFTFAAFGILIHISGNVEERKRKRYY